MVESESASLYWDDNDEVWKLEAEDVSWETSSASYQVAGGFNGHDDDRHFPGLQEYFGDKPSSWLQVPRGLGTNGNVLVSIECNDTEYPTELPTEQPTQQPTMAPTELCTALELTVANSGSTTAVTKYNGIYMKQTTLVNGKDWWKQRFTDQDPLEIIGPRHSERDQYSMSSSK